MCYLPSYYIAYFSFAVSSAVLFSEDF